MTKRFGLKAAQKAAAHIAATDAVSLVDKSATSAYFVISRFMLEKPVPAKPIK